MATLYYVEFEGVVAVLANDEKQARECAGSLHTSELLENVGPVLARKAKTCEDGWDDCFPYIAKDVDEGEFKGMLVEEIVAAIKAKKAQSSST